MAPVHGEKLSTTHADTKSHVMPVCCAGMQDMMGKVKTSTM